MRAPEVSAAGPVGVQTSKKESIIVRGPEQWPQVHVEPVGLKAPHSFFQ